MKERSIILSLIVLIAIFILLIVNNTKAMPFEEYDKISNSSISYSDDKDILYNNIYNFIEMNDDILIGISSYEENNYLYDNYEYITNVAINYIIDNNELYIDKIKDNKINKEEIYNITDKFFNKKYYYISDDNNITLNKDIRRFTMIIDKLNIDLINDLEIICTCKYKYQEEYMNYRYIFGISEEKIYLKNIEVL